MSDEKKSVPNTEDMMKTPSEMLRFLMIGATGQNPVEAQEAEGANAFNNADVLPREMSEDARDAPEQAGVKFLGDDPNDDVFQFVEFPQGWRKVSAKRDRRHISLLDVQGRKRASIFYKAAFYDRYARLTICTRFGIRLDYERAKADQVVVNVEDAGEVVFSTEPVKFTTREQQNNIKQSAYDEAEAWLEKNYPDWGNPTAYWD